MVADRPQFLLQLLKLDVQDSHFIHEDVPVEGVWRESEHGDKLVDQGTKLRCALARRSKVELTGPVAHELLTVVHILAMCSVQKSMNLKVGQLACLT